jgi:hypothetical protein
MKTKQFLLNSLKLLGIIIFMFSCAKDKDTTVADPEGTITVNLNDAGGVTLYSGPASKAYYQYPYVLIGFGMVTSTLNTNFNITVCPDASNPHGENFYNTGAEAANMGIVDGLGNVTTKPASGYSNVSAIEKGHGYVLRYRKSYDQADANLPYFYSRFYVVDWLKSATNGGVIGVKIKYQGSF